MDLVYAEEEADLQAAAKRRNIRRWYTCGNTRHHCPSCPLRKQHHHRQALFLPQARKLTWQETCQILLGVASSSGKELSSEQPQGGIDEQALAPYFVYKSAKGEYKPGLFCVLTVKGFVKSWFNWIRLRDVWQFCLTPFSWIESAALKSHEDDSITIRLATGARVTVP